MDFKAFSKRVKFFLKHLKNKKLKLSPVHPSPRDYSHSADSARCSTPPIRLYCIIDSIAQRKNAMAVTSIESSNVSGLWLLTQPSFQIFNTRLFLTNCLQGSMLIFYSMEIAQATSGPHGPSHSSQAYIRLPP
eukprot:Gb_41716 [translate_table: standard]